MKLKVTLNRKGHNKANVRLLSTGWDNQFIHPRELAAWIGQGFAWAGTHFASGKRAEANARGSNVIVFDFDGELQLADFWATDTAKQWCCLTYTSASSTPDVNRFRALFPLAGTPLTTSWEHKAMYHHIAFKLATELGIEFKDDCGQKPERLWYGNDTAEVLSNEDGCVPADEVASVDIPPEPAFECGTAEGITDVDVSRCQWLLRNFINPSEDGEYNEVYVPVLAACAAIGDPVVDAWIDWVSRGHHGDKPENMDPKLKWSGLGQRSGPTALYAMAKRQDPNWTQALPARLQYRRRNNNNVFPNLGSIVAGSMHCVPPNAFTRL